MEASGLKKAFFTNSGAEAIEGALKMAKRYAYDRDKNSDHEVIAMNHSFHGRTMGALALTGNSHYQEPFGPMISGIKFAEFNNLDSVKALINEKHVLLLLNLCRGKVEFIRQLRNLWKESERFVMTMTL